MTTNQLRKLNVIIQKGMMSTDQARLLITLMSNPVTTVSDLSNAYYGAQKEGEKNTMKLNYIKKYLKALMLKLDYWGLPHIITVNKDQSVKLTMKEDTNERHK